MNLKKSIYNIFFSLLSQIIMIVFGLILPRLFLLSYGSEVNGLLSSISQVFIYITLLEAGVGTATLQALYNPVSQNDNNVINGILSATRRYYIKSGLIYVLILFFVAIAFPNILNTTISKLTIFSIVLINGVGGLINFFYLAKYRILLQAEGKNYIFTNLGTIVYIFTSIIKIILIQMGYDFIVVQTVYIFLIIFQVLYVQYYIKKNYKWLNFTVKPSYNLISQKNSVLIHQISALVFNSTDILILSFFCNLKVVSVYTLYTLLFGTIGTFSGIISNGITFVFGQTFGSDSRKFVKLHDIFELYYMAIVFAFYTVAYIFVIPFIRIYTSNIIDINYVDYLLPMLFVAINIISNGRTSVIQIINVSGHFKDTQKQAIIEAILNLVISVALVNFIGIYGVLIGTILASLKRTFYFINYANKNILGRSPNVTFLRWGRNTIIFIILIIISSQIKIEFDSYLKIAIYSTFYTIVISFVFLLVNSISEIIIFKESMEIFKKFLNFKIK